MKVLSLSLYCPSLNEISITVRSFNYYGSYLIVYIKISTIVDSYNKENQLKFATQGILSRRLHVIFSLTNALRCETYALKNVFIIVTLHFQAYNWHILRVYLKILLCI